VYLVTSALTGAVERGTAQRLRGLGVRAEIAAKTGSTNDYRDAWLVGYTPEVAIGVWVGLDDGEVLGASGAAAALPIFADFMRRAGLAESRAYFARPERVESVSVDLESGLRAGFGCPGEPELFLAGTEPEQSCGWFARLREPELSRPWWRRALDPESDVSMGPSPGLGVAPQHPSTCLVRFEQIRSIAPFRGGVDYVYRVEGVAGQGGRVRLSAPFPRRVEGPSLRVGPGAFDEALEIELPAGAEALLVELELDSGKRCTDTSRLPQH
jgi:hypothetical protein